MALLFSTLIIQPMFPNILTIDSHEGELWGLLKIVS